VQKQSGFCARPSQGRLEGAANRKEADGTSACIGYFPPTSGKTPVSAPAKNLPVDAAPVQAVSPPPFAAPAVQRLRELELARSLSPTPLGERRSPVRAQVLFGSAFERRTSLEHHQQND